MGYLDYFPHHATLWFSHGVICGSTNVAMSSAESARADAGASIAQVATALAAALQTASAVYDATDEEQRDNIDEQVEDLPG